MTHLTHDTSDTWHIWHMTHLTHDTFDTGPVSAPLSFPGLRVSILRSEMDDGGQKQEYRGNVFPSSDIDSDTSWKFFCKPGGEVNVNNHCHYDPSAHAYSNYHQCWLKTKQPSPLISPDTGWVPPSQAGEASLASSHQYSIKKDHYCFIRHSQKIFVIPHKNWW